MSQRRFRGMTVFIAVFMGVGIGVFLDNFPGGDSLISHAQENSRETVILDMNQVMVPSTNVKRSIDFYTRLGLKEIVRNLPTYSRFECPGRGVSTFSVHLVKEPITGPGTTIYFECSDLDERVEKMKGEGFVFDRDLYNSSNWRMARLRDPDGNRLVLFWAGENRRYPPWRLKSADEPS